MLTKKITFFCATLLLLLTSVLQAQLNPTDVIVLNPKITSGVLANGLTYYIMPNTMPEKKVELRLALKSGSVSEDDDQQGLAHMAEHMAFNGTKNFKKNDIIAFLQDIGVGFGSDLNAYTYFDRTVYILPIPTDKPGNLEKGFQVIEDWAHNVTYNTDDINGERQIILEESRLGKGAGDRMQQKWLPSYFNGSRYGQRLPIGKDSIITNFNPDAIRRYYKEWYRPELMAVMVVGDITKEKGLEMINKHFAGIEKCVNPRPLPAFNFHAYTQDVALVTTDKEATSYGIQLSYPAYPKPKGKTVNDYVMYLKEQLFNTMLNARFREITQKPNPPFLFASGSFGGLVKGFEQFSINASSGTNDPTKALTIMVNEVERVKQYGYLQAELDRAKKSLYANYESSFKNKDKAESGDLTEELLTVFLDDDVAPGIAVEFDIIKKYLPTITLADVNAMADKLKGNQKKFVNLTGPETPKTFTLPTNEQLLAIVTKAESEKLVAYEEKAIATNLLAIEPKAGKVTKTTNNATLGTTELTLSNGVTVTLKPTTFKDDEIKLQAARLGGSSNYGLADKYSAQYATQVQAAMGYGNFDPKDLTKSLTGKKAQGGAGYSDTKDFINGSSTIKDLETMFQLIYLKVTSPRKDTALFSSFVSKNKAQFANIMSNPQAAFIDTMVKFMYNNNPMAPTMVPSTSNFDKINLDRVLQIYKERVGDVTGMHFVIAGSFKPAELTPLLEKYIASLPANGKKTTFKDNKVRTVTGNKTLEYKKGKEQKSLILQMYTGAVAYSEDAALKADLMTKALNIKIIEEIREKAQAIYGGGVSGGLEKIPYPSYNLVAQLPTGPDKVETVLKSLKAEIEKIQKNGPDKSTLDKVKKTAIEEYKTSFKENSTWVDALLDAKVDGANIDRYINYEKYVNSITVADLKKAAQLYLNPNNIITAIQQPEVITPKKAEVVGGRDTKVAATYTIPNADVTIEIYDNAQVDGDLVTLYLNGSPIVTKQALTDKPQSFTVKARKGVNTITMYADNLGTTPPNTAYMIVKSGDKTYKLELSSTLTESASIILNY